MVAIPANASYRVTYECSGLRETSADLPLPVVAGSNRGMVLSEAYNSRQSYPLEQVTNSGDAWLRDFRVLSLQSCPVSWDPVRGSFSSYEAIRVTIELSYPDGPGTPYTTYSAAFREIYEANILNFADFRNLVQGPQNPKALIIHGEYNNSIFNAKLKEFVAWKRQKGIDVTVASTAVAGNNSVAIKAYIKTLYNNSETRPDYIILVGDVSGSFSVPTWYEVESGYNGEGDDTYTFLSGDDALGDAFIGRISAENLAQLGTMLNKIYAYEKNVDLSSPASDWLNRMLLIGDPTSSGISCAYVTQHVHEVAKEANPEYSFIENYSSGFESTMNQGLNQGVGFFTYRGIYGVSGWYPSDYLFNGVKLPHSVILTCDTGSFASDAMSEVFVRLGTEAVPSGAVSCIGMATTGTHTALNNSLLTGMMDGIFTFGMRTMGQALLSSKLYTHNLYSATMSSHVRFFSHWCNLIGDPSLETWVGIPGLLNLDLPSQIPTGMRLLEVPVTDNTGSPVDCASVTAYSPTEDAILSKAFTGADGIAYLEIPQDYDDTILVTAYKTAFKAVQTLVSFDTEGALNFSALELKDDGTQGSLGNGDGFANATETVALSVQILNSTGTAVSTFNAGLSTDNPRVQILSGSSAYPSIGAGETAANSSPFLIKPLIGIAPTERVRFVLRLSGEFGQNLEKSFYLDVFNAALGISNYTVIAGGNNVLDPGETCFLDIELINNGCYPAEDLRGELSSLNTLVTVSDSLSFFGSVASAEVIGSEDGFTISGDSRLIPGMQIPLKLKLYNDAGFEQYCTFNLPVGTVSQTTPLGPDEYGYLMYDVTDTAYPECPSYDWIEISPAEGGAGIALSDISDSGVTWGEGDDLHSKTLKVLNLPFLFPFYGVLYDRITVSTNGFIAFGETADGEFRNSTLPGGQGPAPMVAVFWDDLSMSGPSNIYEYFDAAAHLYIIQWDKMRNGYDNETPEVFQMILYDPLIYHTGLGDGMIKIQYKIFNNIDVGGFNGNTPLGGNFCTVGIKDHTNTRGLQYTFNNLYPQAAAPLSHETALLITTVPADFIFANLQVGGVVILEESGDSVVEPGETAEIGIKLKNLGLQTATNVSASIGGSSPFATFLNSESLYPDIANGAMAVNNNPFVICVSESCPNNERIILPLTVEADGNSWSYSLSLEVKKPSMTINGAYMSDSPGNKNGILEQGENALLVVNLKNNSPVLIRNLSCQISANPSQIALTDTLQILDEVPPNSIVQAVFGFVVDESVPTGTNAVIYVTSNAEQVGSQTVQTSRRVGGYSVQSFENNNANYISSGGTGDGWQWGSSDLVTAHSGSKLWGTNLNGNYSDSSTLYLTSNQVYVSGSSYLEFWHCYDTESGKDGGRVQVLTSGLSTTLEPIWGYPASFVDAIGGPGYSGQSGWVKASYDISSLMGRNVRFRWVFFSDEENAAPGWYIDDVSIIGYDGLAGIVSGQISLEAERAAAPDLWVKNQAGICSKADSTGTYTIYLPLGEHTLTVFSPGFESVVSPAMSLQPGAAELLFDTLLYEFKAVEGFSSSHTADTVHLAWQAPVQPHYPVTAYRVMRKLNAAAFEELALVQDLAYEDLLVLPGRYLYEVIAVYEHGESLPSPTYSVDFPFTDIPIDPPPPTVTRLYANYPNPFNPNTTISFDLAAEGEVDLRIFNLRGQLVQTLCHSSLGIGHHRLIWDGTDSTGRKVSSGVYFYRLKTPDYSNSRRMILLK